MTVSDIGRSSVVDPKAPQEVRMHVLQVMKRKPCLHDSTVMIDLDQNRLVEIPHSSGKQPDNGLTEIQ